MKDIQEWLGHSDFSTTANIYAHLDTSSKSTSALKMTGAFSIDPGIQASVWENSGENSQKNGCISELQKETLDTSIVEIPSISEGGAGSGTRTHTELPPTDFESVTSTNSITPANLMRSPQERTEERTQKISVSSITENPWKIKGYAVCRNVRRTGFWVRHVYQFHHTGKGYSNIIHKKNPNGKSGIETIWVKNQKIPIPKTTDIWYDT